MGKNLYVGNLPYDTTEEQLRAMFAECGAVTSARVISDRDTGRSRGFGFVEMATDEAAQAAITKFNGSAVGSRNLVVNEARPQEKRSGGFGGGDRGGYQGRRSGGGGGYGRY